MAHVLLPCDLPSWSEVQKLFLRMRAARGGANIAQLMALVHEASSVSLDPDDSGPVLDHPGFERLGTFLGDRDERLLSDMAEWATRLPALKPPNGLHYSLRTQETTVHLERSFVASLLANAFFSTFPRRKAKTHPTLQDFRMADFFTHLDGSSMHQRMLRTFFRYFESLEPEPDGTIQFTRKVFQGPPLPSWLCSERPLVPLVVRPQGTIDEAEPWVFRGCSCGSYVGGDVLTDCTSQESCLFFECPELMSVLCFCEGLVDEEALIVEGVRTPNTQDVNLCLMDVSCCASDVDDVSLRRWLNKAVAAFSHRPRVVDRRRETPDGGESSEGRSDGEGREGKVRKKSEKRRPPEHSGAHGARKQVDKASSRFSMRTASESSARPDEEYYTADEESESATESSSHPMLDADPRTEEEESSSRQSSLGFVLGGNDSEDDDLSSSCCRHERLEDFRRRIRRRTRRKLSSSRRSYSGGSSSSDMEDISEDPEEEVRPVVTVRPACSEPSLVALAESAADIPAWVSPEVLLSPSGQKQLLAATTGGHLKAYSHDGVRPNLPVPFRARFRTAKRRASEGGSSDIEDKPQEEASRCPVAVSCGAEGEDPQLRALVLWLAASMAQLPALILYTGNEPTLREVIAVYRQVLHRQWTVGDLACEVLRFCRNRSHRTGRHSDVFGQLMAEHPQHLQDASRKVFKEQSLD